MKFPLAYPLLFSLAVSQTSFWGRQTPEHFGVNCAPASSQSQKVKPKTQTSNSSPSTSPSSEPASPSPSDASSTPSTDPPPTTRPRNPASLPEGFLKALATPTGSAVLSLFQEPVSRLNPRLVFTDVLRDASRSGGDSVQRAQWFAQEIGGNVAYTTEEIEKFAETLPKHRGVALICRVDSPDELLGRCSRAAEYGDTVYIPVFKHTETPTVTAARSGDLGSNAEMQDKDWFNAMAELRKQEPGLKIFALYIGEPTHERLHSILEKSRKFVDGIVIDWEYAPGACWNKVNQSPPEHNWMWFLREKVRYVAANQDNQNCKSREGNAADEGPYLNTGSRGLPFPAFLTPVFPCHSGKEWRCHMAMRDSPNTACNPQQQRYQFSLSDATSVVTLKYFISRCQETLGKFPEYDLVRAI